MPMRGFKCNSQVFCKKNRKKTKELLGISLIIFQGNDNCKFQKKESKYL